MKLSLPRRAAVPLVRGEINLAASWYIALRSDELTASPRAVELFDRPLVAWRDDNGRAVLMPRHCPHMGASLADGKVMNGCLRCPFHHWRFASSGQCVEAPGIQRIPATARQYTYPVVERYGYIWAWYGSAAPMFAMPEIPALEVDRPGYRSFRLADLTAATVRRILENTYDPDHLAALHGLKVAGPLQLRFLSEPQATLANGPPIEAAAWLGAIIEWPSYTGTFGAMTRLVGTNADRFTLLVDGWPGGQRITYFADGIEQYRLLLATTPVAANRTIQHIAVAVATTGRFWRDLARYLIHRLEITVTSNQDLPIFNTIQPGDRDGIYVKRDFGVVRFRDYYQSWVDKAQAWSEPEPDRGADA